MEAAKSKILRPRRSKQDILDLLNAFEKSNSTIKEFCELKSLSYGVFQKWRSRYGSPARRKGAFTPFAKIDIVPTKGDSLPGLFAEVHGIKIYQPVSASFLKELLA